MTMNRRKLAMLAAAVVGLSGIAHAASGTWNGTNSTTWSDLGNWTTAVPGATSGTTNADIATFNAAPTNSVPVVDANRNLKSITFDTATVGALTLGTTGGNPLLLTSGGTIKNTNLVLNPITVNAPLNIYGSYTITSSATAAANVLNIGGAITPATATAVTLTLSGTNTGDNTVSGLIGNGTSTALSLVKSSTAAAGKWIISNPNNSFTGPVTVTGVVSVPSIGMAGGNSALGQNGTINLGSAAGTSTLIYTGTGEVSDKAINFGSTSTANSTIDLASTSSGVLKFTGNSTNAGTTKTITLQGTGGADGWFAGNLVEGSAGAGAKLAKSGTNTWTVSGTNTYTGGTTVNAGKLIAGSYNALGTTAGAVVLGNGVTLGLATDSGIAAYNVGWNNNNSPTIAVGRGTPGSGTGISYTLGTLSMGNSSVLSVVTGDNLTLGGVPTLNFGVTTLGPSGGTSSTVNPTGVNVNLASVTNSATTASGKTLVLDGTSTANFVTGVIDNGVAAASANTVGVSKSNSSIWTLSSANTYTGPTIVTGGSLIAAVNGSIGTGALSVNGSSAILSMGSTTQGITSLTTLDSGGSITGSGTLTNAGNFTVKSGTVNVNLTGTGTSTLTKSLGTGATSGSTTSNTVTLTGTNTYGGATTINDGALALTGTATLVNTSYIHVGAAGTFDVSGVSSPFTLASAQTLRGTGSVLGKVTGTGAITPALAGAIGTLTFNDNLTIGGGLNIDVDSDANLLAGGVDLIQGVNALDISGAAVTFNNITPLAAALNDDVYVFAKYSSLTGTFATVNALPTGYSIDYNYAGGNQIALISSAIPEPATMSLMAIGGLALMRRRRSR